MTFHFYWSVRRDPYKINGLVHFRYNWVLLFPIKLYYKNNIITKVLVSAEVKPVCIGHKKVGHKKVAENFRSKQRWLLRRDGYID